MNVLALAFDFDDTLVPDSSSFFLARNGIDPGRFWSETVGRRIADGWDPVLAYLYEIKRVSDARERPFTAQDFAEAGRALTFREGIPGFFEELRSDLAKRCPDVRLEYYLISSGIGDLIRASVVAPYFTEIWSCEWHYGADGRIECPRNVISFTEKTRCIYQISKGLIGERYRSLPFEVNRRVRDLRIPLEKIVFVGDGLTDVPVFSILKKNKASCFAVFDPDSENRHKAWGFVEDERVQGLFSPRFTRSSDLYQNILMALEVAATKRV